MKRAGFFQEASGENDSIGKTKRLILPEIGLGCMGMSEHYGSIDINGCLGTLKRSIDLGCNLLDTADIYGLGNNEKLISLFLWSYRHEVKREDCIIATKCGVVRGEGLAGWRIDNSPQYIKKSCENSLTRLGVKYIDLYYLHRIADNGEKIEESMRAMADLLEDGKIRYVGICEARPEIVRRANAALLEYTKGKHQLEVLQSEYSLMERTPEINATMKTCHELGITFVPFSPLGRQYLTAPNMTASHYEEGDARKTFPIFKEENAENNQKIVRALEEVAKEKGCTLAQLGLAWLSAKATAMKVNIVPIPGTKRVQYLEENIAAVKVKLTAEEMERIDKIAPPGAFEGDRYPESLAKLNRKETKAENVGTPGLDG